MKNDSLDSGKMIDFINKTIFGQSKNTSRKIKHSKEEPESNVSDTNTGKNSLQKETSVSNKNKIQKETGVSNKNSIQKGVFIFHRDLRINDNMGLIDACKRCEKVYTIFVFTPEQVSNSNKYKSENAIQFMIESLEELAKDIKKQGGELAFFYGSQHNILRQMIKDIGIEAVFFNKDYTPYALERDNETLALCQKEKIECIMNQDYYLFEPGAVLSGSKTAYKKFTPFYDEVLKKHISTIPKPILLSNTKVESLAAFPKFSPFPKQNLQTLKKRLIKENPDILVHGGRSEGGKTLNHAVNTLTHYDETRDELILSTSHLSAYIKFGCVSVREVFSHFQKKYGAKCGFLRELIWREFFAHVLFAYPQMTDKRGIRWSSNEKWFDLWTKGDTGFPVVDAGMRELNATGYMHNRCRMVVASFLIKTLGLNWEKGEKYFAQKLTDYDVASNNGNWQSISGSGVDMKPFYRDMNPWIQSVKFDPQAEYIKKWVPELKDVDQKVIHKWYEYCEEKEYKDVYMKPIVDYKKQKDIVLELYKKYL
jgi:deoxyribodipyrimidine photo-lyase